MWFIVILAIICFLLMEHPVAFWCVFVPLTILFIVFSIKWFRGGGLSLSNALVSIIVVIAMVIALLIVCTPDPCNHEVLATEYAFASYDSPSQSYVRNYCKNCEERSKATLFRGTPIDTSYLAAIVEHSDGSEIIPGQYYTVTATVPQGYNYGSYGAIRPWLGCQVENEGFIVRFDVEFREEYREILKSIEAGDEITFRGKFYDEGCGFLDCELLK